MRKSSSAALAAKVLLTVAALALLAAGCAKGEDAGPQGSTDTTNVQGQVVITKPPPSGTKPKRGGKLVYGIEAETDGYDPSGNRWAISGTMVANAVLDPIAAYDENLVPQPYLAEKIEHNADYTEWTIKFRPGITFHNGQPLNADAGNKFTLAIKNSQLTGPAAELATTCSARDTWTASQHRDSLVARLASVG